VFADYEIIPGAAAAAGQLLTDRLALTFGLGGLSKSIGLPQAKLGWIAVAGPADRVRAAMVRVEYACDAYLSVSTPVQMAAGELLDRGVSVREQIQQRIRSNYKTLCDRAAQTPACQVLRVEAGWSAVIQVPTLETEEDLVLRLLDGHGVLVHPGYFFDFSRESFLVISLLTPSQQFRTGIDCIFRHFDCRDPAMTRP
jgi:aspartate/methionine/tyrosine aminotransferase